MICIRDKRPLFKFSKDLNSSIKINEVSNVSKLRQLVIPADQQKPPNPGSIGSKTVYLGEQKI